MIDMFTANKVSKIKKSLLNIGLIIASIVVFSAVVFICGEVALRLKFGSVPPGPNSTWYQHDDTIGWIPKPGHYSFFHVPAFRRVDLTINEFGLRNRPITAKVAAGQTRVSVVGDSFVFGAALSDGETLTARMQSLAGDKYDIVNISAERYGTGQEIRLLERLKAKGFQLGSKLILAFFTNDILDNLALTYDGLKTDLRQPRFGVDATGRLTQVGPEPAGSDNEPFQPTIYKKSLFYRYLLHNVETVAATHPNLVKALFALDLAPSLPREPGIVSAWYDDGWKARWANTRDILAYFVNWLRKDEPNLEIYIAFLPSPFQVHEIFSRIIRANMAQDPNFEAFLEDMDRPQRMLRAFCESKGITFIDTTPALRQVTMAYFPRDGHLNLIGTDVVARLLLDRITSGE